MTCACVPGVQIGSMRSRMSVSTREGKIEGVQNLQVFVLIIPDVLKGSADSGGSAIFAGIDRII